MRTLRGMKTGIAAAWLLPERHGFPRRRESGAESRGEAETSRTTWKRSRRVLLAALLLGCGARTAAAVAPSTQPAVSPSGSQAAPVVLMVSIDGLRADDLSQADHYGLRIPVLRRLMRDGAAARAMISIFPSVTYPAHVTLITGQPPARHGILDNERFQPMVDRHADWYWSARDVQVPTLVDAFRTAGRRTAVVGWPVTVDAPADHLFPELWDAADFAATFVPRSRGAATPGLVDAAEKQFNFALDFGHLDEHKNLIARHIVRAHRPDLLLIHYNELDKKQHQLGPGAAEVFASLEKLDGMLGELLDEYQAARLSGRLLTFVVSDHGFERVDRMFKPNAVLREAGLIDYDQAAGRITSWRAKAWTGGAAAAIVLADPDDAPSLTRARSALEAHAGRPDAPVARFIEKDEIRRLGANPQAAFMIDAGRGWMFSRGAAGAVSEKAPIRGMHGQMPDRPELAAAFIACGRGIPPGTTLERVQIVDVAPTVAQLAGVSLQFTAGRALFAEP